MSSIFSLNWWLSTIFSVFITMCFFYLLKWANTKVRVPVIGDIIENA